MEKRLNATSTQYSEEEVVENFRENNSQQDFLFNVTSKIRLILMTYYNFIPLIDLYNLETLHCKLHPLF